MSADFLSGLANDFVGYEKRAKEKFGTLSEAELNTHTADSGWSIGQCLDHLVKANEPYFALFEDVANRSHRTTFWERLPILPKLFGDAVLQTVHPDTVKKSKAPRIFQPRHEHIPADIVETFCAQQRRLATTMPTLAGVDLRKTIVTSPVAKFIAYSLWHALSIIDVHEERHLRQAERVLSEIAKS